MEQIITFRGKTLTFNVEKGVNKNFISEINGVENKKFASIGHETNNNTEVLSVNYLQFVEVGGEVVEGSNVFKKPVRTFGSYDKFYSLSGEFSELVKAELNAISEFEFNKNCIAFNPLKGFNPIQPITCDYVTSETGVTVDVIDQPLDSTLLYCIGDPKNGNWLPLPTDEIPLGTGVYSFYVMNQSDGYPFGGANEFIIEAVVNED